MNCHIAMLALKRHHVEGNVVSHKSYKNTHFYRCVLCHARSLGKVFSQQSIISHQNNCVCKLVFLELMIEHGQGQLNGSLQKCYHKCVMFYHEIAHHGKFGRL